MLACENVDNNKGGPYGAVVVRNSAIISSASNQVTCNLDPTAHAEIQAIRDACAKLKTFQLTDCILYSSCEPCPMCLGAIYWARVEKVYYACNRQDAARAGFDDEFIYQEINKPPMQRNINMQQFNTSSALKPFELWSLNDKKILY